MVTRIFTFGSGQSHPVTGESLADHYVAITAESAAACRAEMLNRFGRDWAFEYPTRERAGVDRYNLIELPASEWPDVSRRYLVSTGEHVIDTWEL